MKNKRIKINEDFIGKVFNRWTVLEIFKKQNSTFFKARCLCGTVREARAAHVMSGRSRSCGCYVKEGIHQRKPKGHAGLTTAFITYKRNAKTRQLPFDLTKEEFLIISQKPCYYCDADPSNKASPYAISYKNTAHGAEAKEHSSFLYNGIDRIDNNLGYLKNNCLPCCKKCNFAKNKLSFTEFKEWAIAISKKVHLWDC